MPIISAVTYWCLRMPDGWATVLPAAVMFLVNGTNLLGAVLPELISVVFATDVDLAYEAAEE